MTIEELKQSGNIIFECISGSKAYGLDTPTSDTDIRGVFVLPKEHFYSLEEVEQISNESNDIVYYELKKFISLCYKNNPNILELLNVPQDCILYKHPLFDEIQLKYFLSKQCQKSFGNYAFAQIKKARGLEKKIVNPMSKERKTLTDFCFVYDDQRSVPLRQFLVANELSEAYCGLSNIPHLKNCYNLFYNPSVNYKGIVSKKNSNEVSLSHIPKSEKAIALLYVNIEGYSSYCKKYSEYWKWVSRRNEARYESTISHGKNYDAKNMMHTFRLLNMAKEIAVDGKINVKRNDRKLLLDIKEGKYDYDELLSQAEEKMTELESLYSKSELPDQPSRSQINALLVSIREKYYNV